MWLDEVGRGWVTVAVGDHLGSQLGYPAFREPAGTQPPPRAYDGIYDEPVDGEERLHRDVDAAWIVFTSALLSPLVGVARVAIWDPRNDDWELVGAVTSSSSRGMRTDLMRLCGDAPCLLALGGSACVLGVVPSPLMAH